MVYLLITLCLLFLYLYFTNDPYHIVVARYKEDTSWLNGYKYVKIYNKHSGDNLLPNIGRESHTYLQYIVDNYYTLPNRVFFTQGSMSEHSKEPIEFFLNSEDKITGHYFTHKCIDAFPDKDGRINWPQLYKADYNFFEWFNKYIDNDLDIRNSDITWAAGGTFSVRKDMIQSRPKKFYEMLLNQFPDHSDPELGHYFERAWYYIFNCHKN